MRHVSLLVSAALLSASVLACGGPEPPPSDRTASSAFLTGEADAHYEDGMRAWRAGNVAEAEAAFRAALDENPRYLAAHLGLGEVLLARSAWAEAQAAFDDALSLRPTNVDALLGRGRARLGAGDRDGAIADAQLALAEAAAMDSRELQAAAEVLQGSAEQAAGRGDNAIAAFERALALEATALDARTQLARLYAGRYRTDDAIRLLMRGEPYLDSARSYYQLAAVYVDLDAYERALPLLETSLSLSPGDANARYYLALCAVRTGDPETAIGLTTDLIAENPNMLGAYTVRAEGRWRRGLVDSARDDLATVLALQPEHGEALALRADIDADLGNHEAARAGYQQALLVRPHHTRLVSRAAEYAAVRRDSLWVVDILEERIDRPERPARWLSLLAAALVDVGRAADAVPYQSQFAQTRPNDHRLHMAAARAALEHPGTLPSEQILAHARLAIEHVGGAPLEYRVLLIDALLADGRQPEAREVYELAVEAYPNATELRERRARVR